MKGRLYLVLLLSAFVSCGSSDPEPVPQPEPAADSFAKGADLGWITEMETKGFSFRDASGKEMECTALMKSIGFNAVRCRVWVKPESGWCNKTDVLEKARRAKALGMKLMIDFHYGDSWCDPGKQPVPSDWKGHSAGQLAADVASHTGEVLSLLRNNAIDVSWVQVGNEVTNGFLWEECRVSGDDAANFVKVFNAGRDAVKSVYPDATVILHIDNGWNMGTLSWFYSLMNKAGAEYDMIGLSLYPSYWEGSGYPDWSVKTTQFLNNLPKLHTLYGKDIMLVEFGMPVSQPEKCRDALKTIFDGTSSYGWFKGVFYWEPESEPSRNNYDYGAFSNGTPTLALDPFKTAR